MSKFIASLTFAAALITTPLAADNRGPLAPGFDETLARLDGLIATQDIPRLEAFMAEMDAKLTAGPEIGDELEDTLLMHIFARFNRTDDATLETLAAWAPQLETSVYAKTAFAHHYNTIAWMARGNKVVRDTHPGAFAGLREYARASVGYAWQVFETRPEFLPAAVMIAYGYKMGVAPVAFEDFVDASMAAHPSRHLSWALNRRNMPKWGGSVSAGKAFCNRWGDVIQGPEGYGADACMAEFYDNEVHLLPVWHQFLAWRTIERALADVPQDRMMKTRGYYMQGKLLWDAQQSLRDHAIQIGDSGYYNRAGFGAYVERHFGVEGYYGKMLAQIETADALERTWSPLDPKHLSEVSRI